MNENWNPAAKALWQRIQDHPLQRDQALDFHRRLCREQRWSHDYGLRVIEEYKRFVFLSCQTGSSLTPSVDVDETWHLHLTYTEDYWLHFCPRVLQQALHHQPTTGSAADGRRFREQYAQSLLVYASWFGSPPADIWPGSMQRFRNPGRFQRLNRDQYWVIRKPWT